MEDFGLLAVAAGGGAVGDPGEFGNVNALLLIVPGRRLTGNRMSAHVIALAVGNLVEIVADDTAAAVVHISGELQAIVRPVTGGIDFVQDQDVVLNASEKVEQVLRRQRVGEPPGHIQVVGRGKRSATLDLQTGAVRT